MEPEKSPRERRDPPASPTARGDLAAIIGISAVALALFAGFHGRFGDLIVDSGRETVYGWRVLAGEVPYRDFFYEYGPLIPYLIAGLFRLFGVHLDVVVGLGLATTIVTAVAFYFVARIELGIPVALITTATFILVFQFGFYDACNIFNFVFPYSFTATIGFAFLLLLFLAGGMVIRETSAPAAALAGACFGLALQTKIEIALPACVYVIIVAALFRPDRGRRRACVAWAFGISAFLVMAPLSAVILRNVDFPEYVQSVIQPSVRDSPFIHFVFGTDRTFDHLVAMAVSVADIALIGFAGFGADRLFESVKSRRTLRGAVAFACGTTLALLVWFILFHRMHPMNLFRGAGVATLLYLAVLAGSIRSATDSVERNRLALRAAIASAALALALKKPLSLSANHYGFYMTPLVFLTGAVFVFREIPQWFARRYGNWNGHFWYRTSMVILLTMAVAAHVLLSIENFATKSTPVRTERGSLRVSADQAEAVRALTGYFSDRPPARGLAVVPEGTLINFLLGIRPRSYFYMAHPHLTSSGIHPEFLSELVLNDVDHVAVVSRPTAEFGYALIGRDYFQKEMRAIDAGYEIVLRVGPPPLSFRQGFGVELRRKRAKFHSVAGDTTD